MTAADRDVVIASAVRTPIGRFGGVFKDIRAHRLAALVMEEAVRRAGVGPEAVDEIIAGECIQCADEANTARTAALAAGFPVEIPAYTVQKQCASSMQALASARTQILSGEAEAVLVVGIESMSSAPYLLPSARWGQRLMHGEMTDSVWELLYSGSSCVGERMIMGETAEKLADRYGITRAEQDEVALRSHGNAQRAIEAGRFREEVLPVTVDPRKGLAADTDEHPRFGITRDDLARLKPAFREGGTVTAGNSSGLNDGAAAALLTSRARAREWGLTPLARVVAQASAGVPPEAMGLGPVPATRKLLQRTDHLTLEQIGLVELNEAFAAQYLACERELGLDRERVNVNGSGIGLGHPVGCTGLRIVVSLLHEMRRRKVEFGLATLCVGGGMGMATLLAAEK